MAENSKIEWTDHTFNPWVGCTPVSPACDHCYAETWAKRSGHPELWQGERRRTSVATWRNPLHWQGIAQQTGKRPWVFPSLCDPFDNEVPDAWRSDFWALIKQTPSIKWQLLTKRVGNVAKMLPADWTHTICDAYDHVGIMATVANQEEVDRDLPKLIHLKANHSVKWIGISYEPALGPIDVGNFVGRVRHNPNNDRTHPGLRQVVRAAFKHLDVERLDWVIAGGESGPKARPPHPDWFRNVRDQCAAADVPFLFKQWGQWAPMPAINRPGVAFRHQEMRRYKDKHDAGRLLDGRTHDEFPRVYYEVAA